MTTTLKFPQDLLRFLYWVFFKPFTLDRYIHQIDPTLGPDPSISTLWRRSKAHPEFRSLIPLAFFHILVTPWLIGFPVAGLFALMGFQVNWDSVAGGVAFGVVFGVVFGVAGGVAGVVAVGVAFGVAVGV
ncbi:MAG: hypothetical protein AB1817_09550, partial [Chloroflexota bacterium]